MRIFRHIVSFWWQEIGKRRWERTKGCFCMFFGRHYQRRGEMGNARGSWQHNDQLDMSHVVTLTQFLSFLSSAQISQIFMTISMLAQCKQVTLKPKNIPCPILGCTKLCSTIFGRMRHLNTTHPSFSTVFHQQPPDSPYCQRLSLSISDFNVSTLTSPTLDDNSPSSS